jgi:hypothetical protein
MLLVNPVGLQLTAEAVMVTADGPLIVKSDPSAATELQYTESGRFNMISSGVQAVGAMVPILKAGPAVIVKLRLSFTGIPFPQLSSRVFPSLPLTMLTV